MPVEIKTIIVNASVTGKTKDSNNKSESSLKSKDLNADSLVKQILKKLKSKNER
jgi:hypothetical protein